MDTHKNREASDPASKRVRFVSKRAALWYFRIMDEPAMELADRQRFFTWLRRSPDNVAEFLRFLYIYGCVEEHKLRAVESEGAGADELDVAPDALPPNEHANVEPLTAERAQRIHSKTGQLWKHAAVAACVALSILLAIATGDFRLDGTVSTAAGQLQHLTLPDGSVAHLGTRTQLTIQFSDGQRVVHLHQGEAVFEVAKDPDRPFIVTTPLVDVTAVGTRFGVSIHLGVTATVSEGVVQVTAHDNPDDAGVTLLRAGQQLRMSDNTLTQRQVIPVDATRALQWADGWLVFKSGQTIGEAVREFNRHNVVQIEIEQPAIGARELEGPYRFSVDASAVFARTVAANNDLVLVEDRSGKVIRLRLVERRQ